MEVHIVVVCIVTHSVFMELKLPQYKCDFQRLRCLGWATVVVDEWFWRLQGVWMSHCSRSSNPKVRPWKMKTLRFLEA